MSNGQKITQTEARELERDVPKIFFDKFAEHGHKPDKGVEAFKKAIEERLRKDGLHNTNLKTELINIYKNWASGKGVNIYDEIADTICKYVDISLPAKAKDLVRDIGKVVGKVTRSAEAATTQIKREEVRMLRIEPAYKKEGGGRVAYAATTKPQEKTINLGKLINSLPRESYNSTTHYLLGLFEEMESSFSNVGDYTSQPMDPKYLESLKNNEVFESLKKKIENARTRGTYQLDQIDLTDKELRLLREIVVKAGHNTTIFI